MENTDLALIAEYQGEIDRLTDRCPRFWRQDAIQQLKLTVLECERVYDGQLRRLYVLTCLKKRFRALDSLERNRGMRDCPDVIDWYDLERRAKEHAYTVRHVGNTTIFEKHV